MTDITPLRLAERFMVTCPGGCIIVDRRPGELELVRINDGGVDRSWVAGAHQPHPDAITQACSGSTAGDRLRERCWNLIETGNREGLPTQTLRAYAYRCWAEAISVGVEAADASERFEDSWFHRTFEWQTGALRVEE